MSFLRRIGRSGWPAVGVYGGRTRGDIKLLSLRDLERLTEVASGRWSADGRPEWTRLNRDRIAEAVMTVYGLESRSVYRCLVMIILDDKSRHSFTLDVLKGDFDRLSDMSLRNVVTLAHQYLVGFPHLDLDPAQKESWNRTMSGESE